MSAGATGERWVLLYARRAEKDIARLDRPLRRQVLDALGELADNPATAKLRKLAGRPESRLRVREWRVLVVLDPGARTIFVTRVLPRGRAYDR